MDYENASDFEINKAISEILLKDCIELEVFQNTYKASTADVVSQGVHVTSFDFNNPSDAWPLLLTLVDNGCTVIIDKKSVNGDSSAKTIERKIAELYLSLKINQI